jgi:hypothetical protein
LLKIFLMYILVGNCKHSFHISDLNYSLPTTVVKGKTQEWLTFRESGRQDFACGQRQTEGWGGGAGREREKEGGEREREEKERERKGREGKGREEKGGKENFQLLQS